MISLLQKGFCMNLLPINYQQPIPSFKGLWGHSYTQHSNYDRGHCIVETFDYHPFGNESRDFVQKIVTKYESTDFANKTTNNGSNFRTIDEISDENKTRPSIDYAKAFFDKCFQLNLDL